MIAKGNVSKEVINLDNLTDYEIANFYLGIKKIPCLMHSPLRKDNKPSFALYSPEGTKINYKDFSTGEGGHLFTLLSKLWKCSVYEVLVKITNDLGPKMYIKTIGLDKAHPLPSSSITELKCSIREWRDYDIEYWNSYGISKEWLIFANIFPISYKFIVKNNQTIAFKADKYAYAFVEQKEGRVTLKIYQPFNTLGYKWSTNHGKSVISLWTKLPNKGDKVCICSSVKDALCLWANTGIPSVAVQGEGYPISITVQTILKQRFQHIYILFDNDEPGLKDAEKLSKNTGFTNIILPQFERGKDISDYYKYLNNRILFKNNLQKLFDE